MATQAAESWRRLVFRHDCYPWCVFRYLDHYEAADHAGMQDVLEQAAAAEKACPQCVDDYFTGPLLSYWRAADSALSLQHHRVRIGRILLDAASETPVTTFRVERCHARDRQVLHGLNSVKAATTGLGLTFISRVTQPHEALRRSAEATHLGPRRRFAFLVRRLDADGKTDAAKAQAAKAATAKARVAREKAKAARKNAALAARRRESRGETARPTARAARPQPPSSALGRSWTQATTTYNMFAAEQSRTKILSLTSALGRRPTLREVNTSLHTDFKQLPQHELDRLACAAVARTAARRRTESNTAHDDDAAGPPLSRSQIRRVNQTRLEEALRSMAADPCWGHLGLGLGDHRAALRDEFLNTTSSNHEVDTLFAQWFSPLGTGSATDIDRKSKTTFQDVCHIRHGGVCPTCLRLKHAAAADPTTWVNHLQTALDSRQLGPGTLVMLRVRPGPADTEAHRETDAPAEAFPDKWHPCFIGSIVRRPSLIHAVAPASIMDHCLEGPNNSDDILTLSPRVTSRMDGRMQLQLTTCHLFIHRLLQDFIDCGADAGLAVLQVRVLSYSCSTVAEAPLASVQASITDELTVQPSATVSRKARSRCAHPSAAAVQLARHTHALRLCVSAALLRRQAVQCNPVVSMLRAAARVATVSLTGTKRKAAAAAASSSALEA